MLVNNKLNVQLLQVGDKTKKIGEFEKKLKEAEEKYKRADKMLSTRKDRVTKLEKEVKILQSKLICRIIVVVTLKSHYISYSVLCNNL